MIKMTKENMNRPAKKKIRKGLLERRERILDAATEIFATKGFQQATIDDIAALAGVGKGTIYRRVGRKEDFINLLYSRAADTAFSHLSSKIKTRDDPILQFKEAVNAICEVYENNLDLMSLLISKMPVLLEQKELKKSPIAKNDIFQLIENILQRAIEKDELRPVDTRPIVKGLFFFLNPYHYEYLRSRGNYTKGEIAQLTIDLFLDGLRKRS